MSRLSACIHTGPFRRWVWRSALRWSGWAQVIGIVVAISDCWCFCICPNVCINALHNSWLRPRIHHDLASLCMRQQLFGFGIWKSVAEIAEKDKARMKVMCSFSGCNIFSLSVIIAHVSVVVRNCLIVARCLRIVCCIGLSFRRSPCVSARLTMSWHLCLENDVCDHASSCLRLWQCKWMA